MNNLMSTELPGPVKPSGEFVRIYPASIGQQIWAAHFAERRGDEPLFSTVSLLLTGRLDAAALKRSIRATVARHEALRTILHLSPGQALQLVQAVETFRPGEIDLTSIPERARDRIAVGLTSRDLSPRPGISDPGLFQVMLIKLDAACHVLTLTAAEAICDGPSRDIFLDEVRGFYKAELEGSHPRIEPAPVQYGDFAIWQSQRLQRPEVLRRRQYWLEQLAHATDGEPPMVEKPRPPARSFSAGQYTMEIHSTPRQALSAIAASRGASLFMAVVATFCALLKSQTGIDQISIGSAADYRGHRKFQGVIGLFASSILFRVDLSGSPTFLAILDRVRDAALEAYENQEFPLDLAIRQSDPGRNLYLQPPFAIKIVLQQGTSDLGSFPDLKVEPFGPNRAKARYDLIIALLDRGSRLTATITYSMDRFSAAGLGYMTSTWRCLIDQVIKKPESSVQALADTLKTLSWGC